MKLAPRDWIELQIVPRDPDPKFPLITKSQWQERLTLMIRKGLYLPRLIDPRTGKEHPQTPSFDVDMRRDAQGKVIGTNLPLEVMRVWLAPDGFLRVASGWDGEILIPPAELKDDDNA